mmetsp:Transcript_20036/g.35195  ORF Transcript_20036/g.35195 Transcript_20036/m.35195 type:complete len:234 (+) Transcript_20036:429-1130(+)
MPAPGLYHQLLQRLLVLLAPHVAGHLEGGGLDAVHLTTGAAQAAECELLADMFVVLASQVTVGKADVVAVRLLTAEDALPVEFKICVQVVAVVIYRRVHDKLGGATAEGVVGVVHHLAILGQVYARLRPVLKGVPIHIHHHRDTGARVQFSTFEAIGVGSKSEPEKGPTAVVCRSKGHERTERPVILKQSQSLANFRSGVHVALAVFLVSVQEINIVLSVGISVKCKSFRLEL